MGTDCPRFCCSTYKKAYGTNLHRYTLSTPALQFCPIILKPKIRPATSMKQPSAKDTSLFTATDDYRQVLKETNSDSQDARIDRNVTSANWHLTDRCNYSCKFCFMHTLVGHEADLARGREIILKLKEFGITKLNFVGGEPLLHPHLKDFARYAKENDLTVSMVTNGYLLSEELVQKLKSIIDWIGISIDSARENVEAMLGRGYGNHVQNAINACDIVRKNGIKLKVNTVVTKLNFSEDLRPLILQVHPLRWKVFQMLGILDQNERYFAGLATTREEFEIFKNVNNGIVLDSGKIPVFETEDDMVDSYLMLAPDGSVIQNTNHSYTYHSLEKTLASGLEGIVDRHAFIARGGKYDW
jgi:radical S-adenosyl methionine domain-containing protein 2